MPSPVLAGVEEFQGLLSVVLVILLVFAGVWWSPFLSLVVMLMYEGHHNNNSFWAPYFRILPTTFPGNSKVFDGVLLCA